MLLIKNYQALSLNVLLFLGACFLASKEIIMFNEEFIVFVCFAVFFGAAYVYGSQMVRESFEERSEAIFAEMDQFYQSRENLLESLIKHHENLSQCYSDLVSIYETVDAQIGDLVSGYESSIADSIVRIVKNRLDTFKYVEEEARIQMYSDYVAWITNSVEDEFKNGKDSAKYDEQLVSEAVDYLTVLAKDPKVVAKFQF